MNVRRLAGSRRNKHLPIARLVRPSDLRAPRSAAHFVAGGWLGGPGACGAYCACGVTYDGFDTLGQADALLDRHIARAHFGSKPDHAARAVDIHAIWPPLTADDSTAKQRKAAAAGARGVSANPMVEARRWHAYNHQNKAAGRQSMTERQKRQLARMDFRAQLAHEMASESAI